MDKLNLTPVLPFEVYALESTKQEGKGALYEYLYPCFELVSSDERGSHYRIIVRGSTYVHPSHSTEDRKVEPPIYIERKFIGF